MDFFLSGNDQEVMMYGQLAVLASVVLGAGIEITGRDMPFYTWFYLLLAWIYFSWDTLEPFLD